MIATELRINDRWVDILANLFGRYTPDAEVWVYGSRLGPHCHPGSDLDLALIGPGGKPIPAARLTALREALDTSEIPIVIDLHDFSRLPEPFRNEIIRHHTVFRK
jgi:predicted nucleotidyltransferase